MFRKLKNLRTVPEIQEALIYLERQNKLRVNQCSSFFDKVKHIIKKERVVVSLPVTIAVLITLFAPYITFENKR